MNLDLRRRTIAWVLVVGVIALALFGYMLGRLGAVPLPGSGGRTVGALVANADGLPLQADVLVHGVKIGSVTGISAHRSGTLVTLTLDSSAPVVHANASISVGTKTPLGEPFADLDLGSGPRLAAGALVASRSTVEIDDALAWLDAGGRANLRAILGALGQSAAPASTSASVNGTLAALPGTVSSLDQLLAELRAQRGDLGGIITGGRQVLDTLAARATTLRALTADARTTLTALAGQRAALAGTIARLPALLSLANATLNDARPLIAHATPVAGEVTAAAPALAGALRTLPSATSSATSVLVQAAPISADVVPALRILRALAAPARSALGILGPVLADIVPVAQYLGPRGNTIAAWFANTADLGSHGDAKGDWARFFVMFDPSTLLGIKSGAPLGNSYTGPGDAAHNQAYQPGGYPRLMPYTPALAR